MATVSPSIYADRLARRKANSQARLQLRRSEPVSKSLNDLRVAIVHPFLIGQGGGERVVDALARIFPQAELFTLILDEKSLSPELRGRTIHSTFLDRFPSAPKFYQHLSPLYDMAAARHHLDDFDLIISSGGPGVKTIKVPPHALHVHYCHSPVRYLWDQNDVWMKRLPAMIRPAFAVSSRSQRRRDYAAAQNVDAFVANSDYIGRRIEHYYGRTSTTIYPPVTINTGPVGQEIGDYFLTVGRLVPGKRTELLIEACNDLGRRLIVVGGGPEAERLSQLAGPTVTMAGRVGDAELVELYRGARAFLFASNEDFGIATAEAQSYGLPAIAYGHGGSKEILGTEASGITSAVMFAEQSKSSVSEAILRFEKIEMSFNREKISGLATRFSDENFETRMADYLSSQLAIFDNR
jgi:glycosyltransferase involved in cell wall biosynthesis